MRVLRLLWRYGVESVVVVLMVVLVAALALQVFFRYVVQDPLVWSEELARYALVWITFLGAAVAYRHGTHVVVETVVALLARPVRIALAWFVDGLLVLALLVLLVQGVGMVEITARTRSTILQIPMSWVYASVPVSAVLMLGFQVERTLGRLRGEVAPLGNEKEGSKKEG